MTERKIVSNQIQCIKCKDTPYSANRHDFKYCKCGAVAVDGGMDYLKRVGDRRFMKEMSITITAETNTAVIEAVKWGRDTKRNDLGIAYAVLRALRDTGVTLTEVDDHAEEKARAFESCARLVSLLDESDDPAIAEAYREAQEALVMVGYVSSNYRQKSKDA